MKRITTLGLGSLLALSGCLLALSGCLESSNPADPDGADPADLFSGQTGSPASTMDCGTDQRCREAAEQLAADADPNMRVRVARCTDTGCEALFELAGECSPRFSGPFYACDLGEDEIRARWHADLDAQCVDGACPPPPEAPGQSGGSGHVAASPCESDTQCETLVAGWAQVAGPDVTARDVMCVDFSCIAIYERDNRCSVDPNGPWYDCSYDYLALQDLYLEDTTVPGAGDSAGDPEPVPGAGTGQ